MLRAEALIQIEGHISAKEAKFLRELNERLHELSQPITVLLCTLEYVAGLDSVDEMKKTMEISQEACERLRQTVRAMQAQVREAIEASRTRRDWSAAGVPDSSGFADG